MFLKLGVFFWQCETNSKKKTNINSFVLLLAQKYFWVAKSKKIKTEVFEVHATWNTTMAFVLDFVLCCCCGSSPLDCCLFAWTMNALAYRLPCSFLRLQTETKEAGQSFKVKKFWQSCIFFSFCMLTAL